MSGPWLDCAAGPGYYHMTAEKRDACKICSAARAAAPPVVPDITATPEEQGLTPGGAQPGWTPRREAGLREADHALHYDPSCEECVYLARPTSVAALLAEPVPLDVPRLAAAAQDHETSGIHGPLHCSLACGAAIAAEYARLTDPKGATDDDALPPGYEESREVLP